MTVPREVRKHKPEETGAPTFEGDRMNIYIKACNLVGMERARQQTQEGYTREHDDGHTEGQLALLAAYYVIASMPIPGRPDMTAVSTILEQIQWALEDFGWRDVNPKSSIRDLVRAGALNLAELERRLRAEENR